MSGSPTAAEIWLQEQEERRLQEERRRRAEEERRRREEAERRARIALAAELRKALTVESTRLQAEVAALRAAAADARIAGIAPGVDSQVAAALAAAGHAPETLSPALGRVRALARGVVVARQQVEARRLARAQAAAEMRSVLGQEADRLRQDLRDLRARSAAGEVGHIEPQIDAAVASAGQSPETAASALEQVRAISVQVNGAQANVDHEKRRLSAAQDALRREAELEAEALRQGEEAKSERDDLQHRVQIAQGELRVRVSGIEADDVAMTWSGEEVRAVSAAVDTLPTTTDPDEAIKDLGARLDEALAHAQVRQLAEERRAYIVQSLQEGLRKQGFQVGEAVLVGSDLQGEVAFRAVRADSRWVDVNVPPEGHVFYDVDGTDRITEPGADGLHYTSCDETEGRLEALHEDLNQRFGIEAGELFWETKDPNRRQRNAKELPGSGPAATRERGRG